MVTEQNKALVQRYITEAINRNHPQLLDMLCAPAYVVHTLHYASGVGHDSTPAGLARIRARIADWHNALPDFYLSVDSMVAEADRVVTHWTISGSHHGPYYGVPPTGRALGYHGITTFRVVDGVIAEEWVLEDRAGLWQQLGVLARLPDTCP